jgi:hypothetical protein
MNDHGRSALAIGCSLTLIGFAPAGAVEPTPFPARAGLELAHAAAQSWSVDAVLVYLENDEPVDPHGAAQRWGYLYYSRQLDQARAYSIRDGRILVAETLDMKFEAPPVPATWIDSDAALGAAESEATRQLGDSHDAPRTMLLTRGAFHDENPDRTTWTLVYAAGSGPALFVVVDAASARVLRTWRG